jgi:peptidoglycan/LPS O-acetylase OafA/YrhL
LPFVVILLIWVMQLPDFGRLQYNDYYELLPKLADDEGHYSKNPLTYISLKSNEHTVALPAFVYVVNAKLTAGDNRGLSVVSLIFMIGCFALLFLWLPDEWRRDPLVRVVVIAILAVFAMTPMAAHNVVKGFSGTIWLFANFLALSAMTVLLTVGKTSPWKLWAVIAIGALGALTYSTTMSLWPALIVGGLLMGLSKKHVGTLAAAGTLVVAVYVSSVRTPGHHPGADVSRPADLFQYLATYLGNVLTGKGGPAMIAGAVGLVLFVVVLVVACRSSAGIRERLAPWIMLSVFGLGNGIGTAVTRGGFGIEQAMASRYATLSGFFWLGLLAAGAELVAASRDDRRRVGVAVVGAVGLALAGWSFVSGVERLKIFVRSASYQPAAELAVTYGIWDEHFLRWITPDPGGPIRAGPFLQQNRHIPFDRPSSTTYGHPLPDGGAADEQRPGLDGYTDGLVHISGLVYRVEGWVACDDARVRRLLVIDGHGIVRGEARIGLYREDLTEDRGSSYRFDGFGGYVLVADPELPLRVHVQFKGDELFYPVGALLRVDD